VPHPAHYTVDGINHAWKGANSVNGMMFPTSGDGTKSALVFVVRIGLHPTDWYGEPEAFPGPARTPDGGKGYHAPPYRAMAWFYDPNDLLKAGRKAVEPWSVTPYAMKDLSGDFFGHHVPVGGAGYDLRGRRIYVIERGADQKDPYERWPVVHVYEVK
jgi:hypothetical protein